MLFLASMLHIYRLTFLFYSTFIDTHAHIAQSPHELSFSFIKVEWIYVEVASCFLWLHCLGDVEKDKGLSI